MRSRPQFRRAIQRAFTLIEMMIVVAIVGVLSVLGIVGYRALILSAHTSEATHMVQSIRVAQEAIHAEAQTYVSTTATLDGISSLFPVANAPPGNWKSPWSSPVPPVGAGACGPGAGAVACWGLLPVHSDGPVMYGYATYAGAAGTTPPGVTLPIIALAGPTGNSTTDYYWITATGNPNNNTSNTTWSYVVANSFTNDLYVHDQ